MAFDNFRHGLILRVVFLTLSVFLFVFFYNVDEKYVSTVIVGLAVILYNPVVHLVLRRDGLTPETVWAIIRATSARLREEPARAVEAA